MKKFIYLPLFAVLAIGLSSCISDDVEVREEFYYPEELAILQQTLNLPEKPLDYNVVLPQHLSRSGLFARNIDKDMATLGRVLFYDKALSSTGEVSCASCHKQELAFSDNKVASEGVDGQTERNSLALGSVASFAAYYGVDLFGTFGVPFMWDNRFGTAREQAHAAFTSEVEMGLTIDELVSTVENLEYYEPLFRRAFENTQVTEERIMSAVAEFVDGLGTFDSKFDRAAEKSTNGLDMNVNFSDFTAAENRGKEIYLTSCAGCHSSVFGRPVMNAANNGLDMQYEDEGIGGFTQLTSDQYTFKIPTLRNVAQSAPYMHDGRFATLEDVVDFYSDNIADHPKLHELLRDESGQPKRLNLSDSDKAALVAFLETLTDVDYLQEVRYSDPFR
ncbi:cytochrome-c peroxidase [Lewinella sp. LCG006]|uniref:cytochrome-c peroxidase n=1 Tax=Lewinella sp. LCG006 TaxID=3231911 RepID=UPI003461132E